MARGVSTRSYIPSLAPEPAPEPFVAQGPVKWVPAKKPAGTYAQRKLIKQTKIRTRLVGMAAVHASAVRQREAAAITDMVMNNDRGTSDLMRAVRVPLIDTTSCRACDTAAPCAQDHVSTDDAS